jgi:DNA-directed RNA polymerase specialized sigma24 family protein
MDQFRELYERYYADVYRFALFLTGDVARAEDLTADTFVRAWTARERIRQNTVRAYLLTITRNLFATACAQRGARSRSMNGSRTERRPWTCGWSGPQRFGRSVPGSGASRAVTGARCCSTSSATCRMPRLPQHSA